MAGHKYQFTETVPLLPGSVESSALGASDSAADRFVQADVNKFVKLAADDNYVLAASGNDIEGLVVSIEPHTVNNGWSFGSTQIRFKNLRVIAGAALDVGDTVVAGTQAALGTAQEYPTVIAGAGALFKWRVKSLLNGTGQAGEQILIEPITR